MSAIHPDLFQAIHDAGVPPAPPEAHQRADRCIVKYTHGGEFVGVIAGAGRHRGTWDSTHARSTAYRIARALRQEDPAHLYRVESAY